MIAMQARQRADVKSLKCIAAHQVFQREKEAWAYLGFHISCEEEQ